MRGRSGAQRSHTKSQREKRITHQTSPLLLAEQTKSAGLLSRQQQSECAHRDCALPALLRAFSSKCAPGEPPPLHREQLPFSAIHLLRCVMFPTSLSRLGTVRDRLSLLRLEPTWKIHLKRFCFIARGASSSFHTRPKLLFFFLLPPASGSSVAAARQSLHTLRRQGGPWRHTDKPGRKSGPAF